MNLKSDLNILILIFVYSQIWMVISSKYQADKYCSISKVNHLIDYIGKEIIYEKTVGLKCKIKNSDFTLDINSYNSIKKDIKKHQTNKTNKNLGLMYVEFNWPIENKAFNSFHQIFFYLDAAFH